MQRFDKVLNVGEAFAQRLCIDRAAHGAQPLDQVELRLLPR